MIPNIVSKWLWNHAAELIGGGAIVLVLLVAWGWIELAWAFLATLARSL